MAVLTVKNLVKKYPSFRLNEVSFDLKEGQITGFIGRNGAGKTTTLHSIMGLLIPDSGEITFWGKRLSDDRFATVKGCVISLLEGAYAKRIRVAIIRYGGGGASLDLPFTSSAELAAKRIESLKGGGSTPLVQALGIAGVLLDRMREEDLSIFLLSDGRYNRSQTGREVRQVREFGDFCRRREIPITFIDAGPGNRTARERSLLFARQLQAKQRRLDDLRADWFLPEAEAEN